MQHENPLLERAVQYLKGKGEIRRDIEIANALGYNKATVSSYLQGKVKASQKFEREFENTFKIKLTDFASGNIQETILKPDGLQLLSEAILQIKAESQTNRQLLVEVLAATSQRSVTEMQVLAESLLQRNLTKILHELKQG